MGCLAAKSDTASEQPLNNAPEKVFEDENKNEKPAVEIKKEDSPEPTKQAEPEPTTDPKVKYNITVIQVTQTEELNKSDSKPKKKKGM